MATWGVFKRGMNFPSCATIGQITSDTNGGSWAGSDWSLATAEKGREWSAPSSPAPSSWHVSWIIVQHQAESRFISSLEKQVAVHQDGYVKNIPLLFGDMARCEMIWNPIWHDMNWNTVVWNDMNLNDMKWLYDMMVWNDLQNDCMKWLYEMIVTWLHAMTLWNELMERWWTVHKSYSFGNCRWLNGNGRRYSWCLLILFALSDVCQKSSIYCK